GIHAAPSRRRKAVARCGIGSLSRATATGADDLACDADWFVADGGQAGHRSRGVCSPGARDHRRPRRLGGVDRIHCASCLLSYLSGASSGRHPGTAGFCNAMSQLLSFRPRSVSLAWSLVCVLLLAVSAGVPAADLAELSLQQAHEIALRNHPRISVAAL